MVSLTMTDLRAKLKHRRSGENHCSTIECQCERRSSLDEHYNTPNVVLAGQTAHPTSSSRASVRCMALAPHLWMVVWLRKFRPYLLEKYDGTIILTVGGNEAIMINYFPVALIGMV
jgi:hypothetical protein